MKRSRNIVLMTVVALGAVLIVADVANAGGCGRRGGGGYGGGGYGARYSGGGYYSGPRYNSYPPSYPVQQPVYQPAQPVFPQSGISTAPGSVQQSPTGGQPFGGAPQNGGQQAPQPGVNAAQQQQQPAASQTAPADGNASNSAEMSALQALGGFAPPATTDTSSNQQASYVGTWSAGLTNGARVQLNLQADGSFSWAATNKSGRTSSFEGTYTIDGGSLTLIRSTDNQKLAGNMNINGSNAFEFKLAGQSNAAALKFTRS